MYLYITEISEVSSHLGHCQVEALVCGPNLQSKLKVKEGKVKQFPFSVSLCAVKRF